MVETMPPSTSTSLPVMNEALSDVRNSTTFATSSGRPRRPSGLVLMMSAMIGCRDSSSRFIGVSLIPGDTERMRAPRAPHTGQSRRTSRCTPRFDVG